MNLADELLGDDARIVAIRQQLDRLLPLLLPARRPPPILLQGETGTGKGLLARVIHRASPRAAAAFVDVDCAAIPETLLEAELFGVERGAFTDARETKPGLLRAAQRGTIFLGSTAHTSPSSRCRRFPTVTAWPWLLTSWWRSRS